MHLFGLHLWTILCFHNMYP